MGASGQHFGDVTACILFLLLLLRNKVHGSSLPESLTTQYNCLLLVSGSPLSSALHDSFKNVPVQTQEADFADIAVWEEEGAPASTSNLFPKPISSGKLFT